MSLRHLLFALSLLGLISACKRTPETEAANVRTIVLLCAHGDRSYELTQAQNLTRLVSGRSDLNLQTLDAAGSAEVQSEQFGQSLLSKPLAILVTPVDAAALSEQVAGAVRVGVLVIGLGEQAKEMPCSTVISIDEHELGKKAGEIAAIALARKARDEGKEEVTGRVVEIRGDETSPSSKARHEGFMEGLKKASGAVLVHDAPGNWTKQGGKDRTAEAMRIQSQFDVLYAHSDVMAVGAHAALGTQRENVLLIGTGGYRGFEGGLSLVNAGDLDATVFHPLLIDFAWKIIMRRLTEPGFSPPPSYRLASYAITPRNVTEIMREGYPPLPEL